MAGMEKICEYSGDYPSTKMYGYKRNLIQICPQYRKLFRGADAHIEINSTQRVWLFDCGGLMFVDEGEDCSRYLSGRFATQTTFTLVVKNPELAGNVEGRYVNWTGNMRQTTKRLKRLLRARNIKVIQAPNNL
jgi:hypothetical protein